MKHLLFILSLCIALPGFAQTKKFTFKAGSAYELPRKFQDLCFFGNTKNGIINLAMKKGELNILRFDPVTLEKTYENNIELPDATEYFSSEIPLEFGGNHIWIHSDWNRELEKEYLFYDKIDIKTGNFLEKYVKMIESTKLLGTSGSRTDFRGTGKYLFRTDADGKKLLVGSRFYPKEKNNKKNYDVVSLSVFDGSMKKLWNMEYTIPTTEQVTDIIDYSVDSKGNAYLVTRVFSTDKKYYKDPQTKKPGYYYEVSKFSKDAKSPQVTRIELGDYYINGANIMENTAHEMVVCGTYRINSNLTGTNGVFVVKIDNQGNPKTDKDGLYPFPSSELAKFEPSKTRRKIEKNDDYEPPLMTIRCIFPGLDGSIFIACEQFQSQTVDDKSYHHTFYYFEDIYCMKIDKKGNMDWFTKIPKKQLGTDNYETLGFIPMSDKDNYYFLYIDNKKNIALAEDDEPKEHINGYGGNIFAAKIDAKGNLTREIVFNPFEEKMMILPTTFTTFGENKFLGRAMLFKGDFKPILITLE